MNTGLWVREEWLEAQAGLLIIISHPPGNWVMWFDEVSFKRRLQKQKDFPKPLVFNSGIGDLSLDDPSNKQLSKIIDIHFSDKCCNCRTVLPLLWIGLILSWRLFSLSTTFYFMYCGEVTREIWSRLTLTVWKVLVTSITKPALTLYRIIDAIILRSMLPDVRFIGIAASI